MHESARITEVAIIGGGLTGLVAAFWLSKKGINSTIIEKSSTIGGVIGTCRENGFTFEKGPNTGVISHPEVAELFDELAGLCELEPADKKAKKRLIWKNGSWHPLPGGLYEGIRTPLFSTTDKIRILFEPFRERGSDPLESLEDMVKRRLGQSFLDYAVDPFISGIYAGDPSYLVTKYALPKLYALEQVYGSFIGGAVKKMLEKKDGRQRRVTKEVFSVVGGLGNLTAALESEIGNGNILTGISDLSVTPANKGYLLQGKKDGEEIAVKSVFVISTAGPHEFSRLFPFFSEEELAVLNSLEYAKIIQVIMGFNTWNGMNLNAFGGLIPSRENKDILGILFPSSFLKQRAPEGGALLSVFLGGFRKPELFSLPDEQIKALAMEETKNMLQIEECNPDLLKIFRYRHAIPQYGRDTKERLEVIGRLHSQYPGLVLAGNIHEGIGMSDRIRQGRRIADNISMVI
jgi:protoporphyrinogen/coproporphyrinogen III oxidase